MGNRKRPLKHVDDQDDLKVEGKWVRSWHEVTANFNLQHHTPAGKLWAAIQQRCKGGNPRYSGVEVGFQSFDEFADWCHACPGYLAVDETGHRYHLDKDLRGLGRRTYAPDTCCFIPAELNSLFTFSNASRGEYPIGVHWAKNEHRFKAQINRAKTKVYLGGFTSPMEAHRAWQVAKAEAFREAANTLPPLIVWLREPLLAHARRIDAEREAGMETIR